MNSHVLLEQKNHNGNHAWCELFCEELPATEQLSAIESAKNIIVSFFKDQIDYDLIESDCIVSPRRFSFMVKVQEKNCDPMKLQEKKGPSIFSSEKAKEAFAQSLNVSAQDLFQKDNYWFGSYAPLKKNWTETFCCLLETILNQTEWTYRMSWGYGQGWIRPIEKIILSIDNRAFLCEKKNPSDFCGADFSDRLEIEETDNAAESKNFHWIQDQAQKNKKYLSIEGLTWLDYQQCLEEKKLIVHQEKRKNFIQTEINKQCEKKGFCVNFQDHKKQNLLNEVTGLVEYPFLATIEFDEKFLCLPSFLIDFVLQKHLRFFLFFEQGKKQEDPRLDQGLFLNFLCKKSQQELLSQDLVATNSCIVFLNQVYPSIEKEALKGYKNVLQARLQDALFCFEKDLSCDFLSLHHTLDQQIWFENLGSVWDKIMRLSYLGFSFMSKNLVSLLEDSVNFETLQRIMEIFLKPMQDPAFFCQFFQEKNVIESYKKWFQRIQEQLFHTLEVDEKNKNSILTIIKKFHEHYLIYQQSVLLCKSDRLTEIVREFPEFEGVMGRLYALKKGESSVCADAIQDHLHLSYLTRENKTGLLIGLIDRLDSLYGFFSIGRYPSGSQDPLGLKGMMQDCLERLFALEQKSDNSLNFFTPQKKDFGNDRSQTIINFLLEKNSCILDFLRKDPIKNVSDCKDTVKNTCISKDPVKNLSVSFEEIRKKFSELMHQRVLVTIKQIIDEWKFLTDSLIDLYSLEKKLKIMNDPELSLKKEAILLSPDIFSLLDKIEQTILKTFYEKKEKISNRLTGFEKNKDFQLFQEGKKSDLTSLQACFYDKQDPSEKDLLNFLCAAQTISLAKEKTEAIKFFIDFQNQLIDQSNQWLDSVKIFQEDSHKENRLEILSAIVYLIK